MAFGFKFMTTPFIEQTTALYSYYRKLGQKAIDQVSDPALFAKYSNDGNSIANIVKHLWGNMRSRWTDFLTSDGEKSWRQRDTEFEDTLNTRQDVLDKWDEGWDLVFSTLEGLTEEDRSRIITIRGEHHTVEQAILRQLAHYAYHVGQIVFIARNQKDSDWQSLSIPRGQSQSFNHEMLKKDADMPSDLWKGNKK